MTNRKTAAFLFASVVAFLALVNTANAGVATQDWSVFCAYAGDPSGAWELLSFFPNNLTINAGDSVTFICYHVHTVTFGNFSLIGPVLANPNPVIFSRQYNSQGNTTVFSQDDVHSSGILFNQNITYLFPNIGAFPYQCILHGTMGGIINVQTPATLGYTPAEVVANATVSINQVKAQIDGVAASQDLYRTAAPSETNASGKKTWTVLIGGSNASLALTYAQFVPSQITINVGDTVAFLMNDRIDVHMIAFNTSCDFSNSGDIVVNSTTTYGNPNYWSLAGDPTNYPTSSTFISSGFIVPVPLFYNVTFSQPGTYCYVCALHMGWGMKGNITVVSSSSSSPASQLSSPFSLLRSLFFF